MDFDELAKLFTIGNLSDNENRQNLAQVILSQMSNKGCGLCEEESYANPNKEFQSLILKFKYLNKTFFRINFFLKFGYLV